MKVKTHLTADDITSKFISEKERRELFFRKVNTAFARLRKDPKAWAEELAERALWDATQSDGLENE